MTSIIARRYLVTAIALAPAVIAAPAAAVAPSRIETLRLEHRAVTKAFSNTGLDDDDPRFVSAMDRLGEIEREILASKSASLPDAQAKLRFAMDLSSDGMWLDGEDANILLEDIARYML